MKKKHSPIGSDFDDFLKEEDIFEEVAAIAYKRVFSYKLQMAMKQLNITKTRLAEIMHTNRNTINRLLDPENNAVTLQTLSRAAGAVGGQLKNIDIEFEKSFEQKFEHA